MSLTEHDRHVCGILAQARWLTTPQLWRLVFPGRHKRDCEKRVKELATDIKGAPALLQRHLWVTRDGVKHVWGLTAQGYVEASLLLDAELVMPPVDFEPETMAHHVGLTELYVGLLVAPIEADLAKIPLHMPPARRKKALAGLYARASHHGWRWTVVGDGVTLPWKIYEDGRSKDKVLRPDAVLELIPERRRLFIEAETGTHTVVPRHADNKPNSTMAKLDRWETYVSGLGDVQERRSWYQVRYPDGYAPEVIFLVHSERRARTVETAIDEWQRKNLGAQLEARALTLPSMLAELGASSASGAASSSAHRPSGAPSGKVSGARRLALTAAEAQVLIDFVTAFRKDFKKREAVAPAEPPVKPASYEPVKALAVRLMALLPA